MKIQGEYTVGFPREAVWKALNDPEMLSKTLPGCETLEHTGDNEFSGGLNVTIGPIKGKFRGSVRLDDIDPPNGYRMLLDGKGAAGFMKGEGRLDLVDADGGTTIRYDIDAKVGGRIAGLGQRVLDSSAKVVTQQGLEGIERVLSAADAGATEVAPAAPSQVELAAKVASGVAADLVPAKARPWIAVGVVAVIAVIVLVVARACG